MHETKFYYDRLLIYQSEREKWKEFTKVCIDVKYIAKDYISYLINKI
jgi:hypothetical protein